MTNFSKRVSELYERLINKMLEPHGVNHNWVLINNTIDDIVWYEYYTMTYEQEREFHEWAVNAIRHSLRYTKEQSEHEYTNFMYRNGLRISDDATRNKNRNV